MIKVALHNLGCKVNSYELEVMQQKLQEKGYHIVPFDTKADIYIVNTCTVTNIADRKSRQMLHRAKQRNPEALVVAVGCYVQTGLDTIEKDDSIDLAIGNNRKKDIADILEKYLATRKTVNICEEEEDGLLPKTLGEGAVFGMGRSPGGAAVSGVDKTLGGATVLDIDNTREYEEMQLLRPAEHTRAYIKIQDGCNQFCSYCAIPLARGRVRSRRVEDILKEIQGIARSGYREVVLTGIHISSYGIDFDQRQSGNSGGRLLDLIELIHEIDGVERIRLGSLEPRIITEENAKRLAALPKICPHFHLSLQSGCDETLKRMNRHYTTGEYCHSVELLRAAFPHPAITTDVIVGFPGETEEEFSQTKAFLQQVQFYEMHIFKYSKRAGTRAAEMPEQVPEQVKAARSNELLHLERQQSAVFRDYYIGKEVTVLLEDTKVIDGKIYILGHTKDYVKVAVPCPGTHPHPEAGEFLTVIPTRVLESDTLSTNY